MSLSSSSSHSWATLWSGTVTKTDSSFCAWFKTNSLAQKDLPVAIGAWHRVKPSSSVSILSNSVWSSALASSKGKPENELSKSLTVRST